LCASSTVDRARTIFVLIRLPNVRHAVDLSQRRYPENAVCGKAVTGAHENLPILRNTAAIARTGQGRVLAFTECL
jgi:hypothetical protein